MLSVLLRFTDSDYPFGIFRLFLIVSYQDMMVDFYIVVGVTNNDITIGPGIK